MALTDNEQPVLQVAGLRAKWTPTKMSRISSLKGRLGWQGLMAHEYQPIGPHVVSSAHFQDQRIRWDLCPRVTPGRYKKDFNIQLREHDVLLMKDGAALGKIAYVDALPGPACLNSHLLLFRPINDAYWPKFVFYVLDSHAFQSYIHIHATGVTFLGISQKAVGEYVIGLPPLPDQRHIAEILDTLDQAIHKTEQLIAKLKQVKQGVLHDLLARGIDDNGELRDPARHPEQFKDSPLGCIPKTWEAGPLGVAADLVDPNPSHRYPGVVPRGVPIASTENFVGDNDFDLTFSTHVPENVFVEQDRRCQFHAQDVVFARKGRLGFARPYGTERKVFSHTVVLIKPKVGRSVHRFLLWSVRAESFFDGIRVRMNTNLGVPTLGVGFLASVPIAVPPVAEQKILAAALDSADARILAEGVGLEKLRQVKQGLMEDLLTGRVRVTNILKDAAA